MIIVTYILLKRNTHLTFFGCNKGCKSRNSLIYTLPAEREGFEPPVPLGTAVFKTAVIDHSTISP